MLQEMDRLLHWQNGEKAWKPFSDAEMDARQRRLRAMMAARGIDACLFTSYHNVCYFSGFLYCSFGRRFGFVIDQQNATTIAPAIDGGQPWRRTHGDCLTYTDWRRDNYFHAVVTLTKGARRVGIEFDHMSLDTKRLLDEALPGVELVDISTDVMAMRTIKSAEEHALIREGARICDIGGAAVVEAIAAGVGEQEVAIASTNAMVREIARSFPLWN